MVSVRFFSLSPLLSDILCSIAYDDCQRQVVKKVDEDPWKEVSWSGDSWGDSPPSSISSLFGNSESFFNGLVRVFSDEFV